MKNAPIASRQDAPGTAAQQGDRADQTEQDHHRHGRDQEHRELAEQLTAAGGQVGRAGQQKDEEQQAEQVAVPLQRARQVGPALAGGQVVGPGGAAWQQRAPVHAQDLDAAEAPPVPLPLERPKVSGMMPLAPTSSMRVQPVPARPEQPQRQLSVLGDDPLVPAAEFVQGHPPDQPHRAC